MNTTDLVKTLANNWDITQRQARKYLDIIIQRFSDTLAAGNSFTLPGLGTFDTTTRDERESYNPHYQQKMKLPPKRMVHFSPSAGLKEEVKQIKEDDE